MEITESRAQTVGGMQVRRALPRRGRRTIGAWCFADHMGPAEVTDQAEADIGPHPHMGLQTVTWLTAGQILHRDSLGSEQLIAPGQLNLMTAGHGVAHSEETSAAGPYRGPLNGLQLWIAQPEATRHGPPAFEHHAELPKAEYRGAAATVLVGEFDGQRSPARHDTPLVGVEVDLHDTATLPLRPDFEYGLVVLHGAVATVDQHLTPGHLGFLGRDNHELTLRPLGRAGVVLLGGAPSAEQPLMWWNFVGRTRAEIDQAYTSWLGDDGRFGPVAGPLSRIVTGPPWWW